MPKVNFSKVEKSFDRALQKLFIDNLSELAAIANVIQDPERHLSNQLIEQIIGRFQRELKRLKKKDAILFSRLQLSSTEEECFARPAREYTQEDWLRLKTLKLRIDELKRELYGQEVFDTENDYQIMKERRRHINKRFNIRDGWLPLH
jgi:16S rRNA C967 or C1407 C5-methylase (RsmB/RsmF family)